MIAARGNDHGFVFNRKPTTHHKIKAVRTKSESTSNKRQSPSGDENNAAQLTFPEPKRRLTERPSVVQEISVPLNKVLQPTPLISRTRTRLTENGFVVGRRGTNVVDSTTPVKPRSRHSRKSTMGGGGRRRSTFSMRGKRASSIGGGFNAIPHESVDPADFYRHISPELPEPIRLRQLLAWCARRTDTPSNWPPELPDHVQKLLQDSLREAVDDIHSAFERGDIATSWYHRPVDSDQAAGNDSSEQELQVHPENSANSELKERLSARISKLQTERDAWVRELKRASTAHARIVDRLPKPVQQLQSVNNCTIEPISKNLATIDWSLLSTDFSYSDTVDADIKQAEEQITRATEELQIQLDAFHLDMHRSHETHVAAQKQADTCLKDLGFAFSQRRARAAAITSTFTHRYHKDTNKSKSESESESNNDDVQSDPTRDLLRTLSATLTS
ncbi:hypothetical protein IW140_005152 [Coemansia sp. RSA 1813]|nr:hypothetical protein EV178_005129 [Coemansia sp. RSA 1646]KAJ1768111.1 hypothetical protein LPJ74_005010 [Coemansia sp. RSA 1843]KAJ2088032.1 hypothetical protein IW138_004540 [Coemansia sp. RSA 986]KAJ2211950.1 hypothetical protein EV179_005057 [Coemansia sp. RSA 487]KAJ2565870.1 hypothetical protein IW140_005152 [Coemansia sp. RSA 1813]